MYLAFDLEITQDLAQPISHRSIHMEQLTEFSAHLRAVWLWQNLHIDPLPQQQTAVGKLVARRIVRRRAFRHPPQSPPPRNHPTRLLELLSEATAYLQRLPNEQQRVQ